MNYQHVLACVDLAAETDFVMQAAQRAAENGAQISVVHVMELPVPIPSPDTMVDSTASSEVLYQELRASARERLAQLGAKYGIEDDRLHLIEGRAATEIHRLAKEGGVDLIVIGSHGQHGLQLLLGSTASAVLHGASCDVLAVRFPTD